MASMSTQMASLSSSSSSFYSTTRWKHDVFLSFYGKDTCNGFTDHLYDALQKKGLDVFKDDKKLEQGTSITPELMKAVEESKYAITILSENYAFSGWCLDELAKIVECMKETELTILPVFYHVNPSDVRNQRMTFEQAFAKHETDVKVNKERMQLWRDGLREVGNISGCHLPGRPESEVIQEIIKSIYNKLHYPKDLVGMNSRVEEMAKLLRTRLDDVHFIGIWGMGGIGKTTLAEVVYNRIYNQFEASSFIGNVREEVAIGGLVSLQKQLLSEILMEKSFNIRDDRQGRNMIANRLRKRKVLIVLDDVNEDIQLEALAGSRSWFGQGSTIIITTRDKQLLIRNVVDDIYKAKELNDDEASKLFTLKAFKKPYPEVNYVDLSNKLVDYGQGLPLAVKVLGCSLFDRTIDVWKDVHDQLKKHHTRDIRDILQIIFDGLGDMEKKIFLDVACFFKGEEKNRVANILKDYGFHMAIETLKDKSLVNVFGRKLLLHDLLQEMGWEIVRRESPELGRRSRLWRYEDIFNVLRNETGTELVEAMMLNSPPHGEENLNAKTFSMMKRLRLLKIHNVQLPQGLSYLSNELRLLQWNEYPLKYLPESFQPKKLVELIMHHSGIERLPKGFSNLQELKLMDLSNSQYLIETPNFIGFSKLESLIFQGCIRLRALHSSVGALKQLTLLNLKDCKNIKSLLHEINLESLEIFILSGCSGLKKFPEIGKNMTRLCALYLDGTAIEELPVSIEHLTGLTLLSLQDCKNISCSTSANLPSLETLNLSGCKGQQPNFWHSHGIFQICRPILGIDCFFPALRPEQESINLPLPMLFGLSSLVSLDLSDCNLSDGALPDDLSCFSSLEVLKLNKNNFTGLPDSISQLSKLTCLHLENCTRLQSLPNLPLCVSVNVRGCTSLENYSDEVVLWNSPLGFNFHLGHLREAATKGIDSGYLYGSVRTRRSKIQSGSGIRALGRR